MKLKKRILALLAAGAMICSALPVNVLAEELPEQNTGGLCEHHQQHTAECGYTEGVAGTPCTHEHSEECFTIVTNCVHEHTQECYPAESNEEPTEPAQPTACTHECSEENGCITKELDCKHEHDSVCGYTEEAAGTPCNFVCEICNAQGEDKPEEQQCVCETLCTTETVNKDCPVCGAEGADLTQCKGKPADEAVKAVQAQIDALPTAEELEAMTAEEQQAVYEKLQEAYEAYNALTDEQKAAITEAEKMDSLFAFFEGKDTLAGDYTVPYLDENGNLQTAYNVTELKSENIQLAKGWYVCTRNTTTNNRLIINGGDVHLILMNYTELTVNGDICVEGAGNLTIYAQSTGDNMGTLTAEGKNGGEAGIGGGNGGTCGNITINGGKISATGGVGAAGIGAKSSKGGGNITINGGIITANGGFNEAGIGGDNITINGGTITATGGGMGAGIGGGKIGSKNIVTINGGTVTANGGGLGVGIDGTFATGTDGHALIIANGGINDIAGQDSWSGIIFNGNQGQVYGDQTIQNDWEIPSGKTLIVPQDTTLTVDIGVTLTNNGTIVNNGTITNYGTINSNGSITNNNTIYNKGYSVINGKIDGNPPIESRDIISYRTCDENGQNWTTEECIKYSLVRGDMTTWGEPDGKEHWYVVNSDVGIGSRIEVKGDVHLILADGARLAVVYGHIKVSDGNSLHIYAQSTDDRMGKLEVSFPRGLVAIPNDAGIGGGSGEGTGDITINGGKIAVESPYHGAGIGSGYKGSGGTVTINGGDVTATGHREGSAAGIGGGTNASGGTVTINGGTVTATGAWGAAGIGDGKDGSGGTFTTGTNGHALIIANGGISDKGNQNSWSGIIFEGNQGQVYGDQTLQNNLEISSDKTLTVPQNTTLTVNSGATLTNNGKIEGYGRLTGNGTLTGTGTVADTIQNDFQKTSSVIVSFEGITDNTVIYGDSVTVKATAQKKDGARAAQQNTMDFYLGDPNSGGQRLNENPIPVVDNTAKLENVKIQGDNWVEGTNTVYAVYGGSMLLKPEIGSAQLTVKDGLKDAVVTVNGEYFYTGSPVNPNVSVVLNGKTLTETQDYTLSYENSNGGAGNLTNAGTVTVTATGTGNYAGTATGSFNIAQSGTAFEGGVKVNKQDKTYTYGDTITVTVTPKATGAAPAALAEPTAGQMAIYEENRQLTEAKDVTPGSAMTFDISTEEANLGSGKHTLTAKFVASANMAAQTGTVEVTVNPAPISGATVTVSGGPFTYDGTPKTPIVEVVLNGKTLTATQDYTLSYENSNGGAGNLTNAGTVTVTATGTGNYSGTAGTTFTINKASAPAITWPTAGGITYGQTLADSALTGGSTEYGSFAWESPNTVPTVQNSGYSVVFTPSEETKQNYEAISTTEQTVTVSVEKATPVINVTAELSGNSNNRTAKITVTVSKVGNGEVPTGTITLTGENLDKSVSLNNGTAVYEWTGLKDRAYTVQAVYSGNDNYSPAQTSSIFNASKKAQDVLKIDEIGEKTYGDAPFTLSATGGSGSGEVTFTSSDSDILSIDGSTATIHQAGTVTLTATKAEDTEYNPATVAISVSIAKKEIVFRAENVSVRQGQKMPHFSYVPVTLVGNDEIEVEPVASCTAPDTDTVGTYTIIFSGAVLTNHDSYDITYEPGILTVTSKPSSGNGGSSSGNGSSSDSGSSNGSTTVDKEKEEYDDFWDKVIDRINKADKGDTVTVHTGDYDKVPNKVMKALEKNGVGLIIKYNGGEIEIPAGEAVNKSNKVYWTFKELGNYVLSTEDNTEPTADKQDTEQTNTQPNTRTEQKPSGTVETKPNPQTGSGEFVGLAAALAVTAGVAATVLGKKKR